MLKHTYLLIYIYRYAWAAVLTHLAGNSEEGKMLLKWIIHYCKWEVPQVVASAEVEDRLVVGGGEVCVCVRACDVCVCMYI